MTREQIETAIAEAGLSPLSPQALEQLGIHLELLLKWNAKLNLSAIRSPEEILHRHFLESLFAAQHIPQGIHSLLDFGSGGGFPGLPIAISRPEITVTLGESQSKKAAFLREVLRTASVANAEVFQGRIEELPRQFEAVTLRAVDKMLAACRSAEQKIAPEGYFIPFSTREDVASLTAAFPNIQWAEPIPLPNSLQRVLLVGKSV